MSKDQPIIFWTSFGVLSVIALGLIGWGASGIALLSTVQANQSVLTQRMDSVERKQTSIDLMATDIAVIKVKLENIEAKMGARR